MTGHDSDRDAALARAMVEFHAAAEQHAQTLLEMSEGAHVPGVVQRTEQLDLVAAYRALRRARAGG